MIREKNHEVNLNQQPGLLISPHTNMHKHKQTNANIPALWDGEESKVEKDDQLRREQSHSKTGE